jgi:hypothetical protein
MENEINGSGFDIRLPDNLEQTPAVSDYLKEWTKLIIESRRKEKRALRLKKINKINAKFK